MAFFLPDLSSWQGNLPNFNAIAATPNMVGCIIKSSQGIGPGVSVEHGHSLTWFKDNWPRVAAAGRDRYGTSFFRGLYHYGTPTPSGAAQADYVLDTVDRAGGWAFGDLPPAWDLEGSAWSSRQQIVDVSSQFAERIKSRHGRAPILYTGSVWRKFGVKDRAGFGSLWTTHLDLMAPLGWPNTDIILHQYAGDGKYWSPSGKEAHLGYPTSVPGLGATVDMNVVIDGGSPATAIDRVRAILTRGVSGSTRGSVSVPIVIGLGAGLLGLGILMTRAGRDAALTPDPSPTRGFRVRLP